MHFTGVLELRLSCQYVQMRATEARDLHMYTDASLQNPPPGIIMPEYVEALQRKKGPPADRTLRGQSTDVAGALQDCEVER